MILFAITSMSGLMLDLLLFEYNKNAGAAIVVTDRGEVQALLAEYDIDCFVLSRKQRSVSDFDRQFKEDLMPGILGDIVSPDTDLPLWKVLSLDRFKFWYNADYEDWLEFIDSIAFHTVYASLDIGGTLPWIALDRALFWQARFVAVRTEPIRTDEMLDFIHVIADAEFVVDTLEDEEFLTRSGATDIKLILREQKKEVESPVKAELRNGLGIQEGELVYGMLFDKRDEWQCRKWLEENVGKQRTMVFPVDPRSAELASSVLNRYLGGISIIADNRMMHVCNKVFAFRADEQYPNNDLLEYIDYAGANKVDEILL